MKKLKYLLMACCAACVWLAACSDDDYEPLPDWWWEQTGEPAVYPEPEPVDNKVVAHRGCYAETGFPQNSVAGLKKAVEMKLFASECDIHLTKDGKVVVYHDDYYLGNTCFKDATYAELCAKGTLANGEKLPLLEEFGFVCEDFGDGTVLVRQVPSDLEVGDVPAALEELAEDLRLNRADPAAARDSLLQTMACKSAIKAGMWSDPSELQALADKVQSGEIRYCPHGRPVAVKLSKYEMEKMFKRA